MRTLYTLVIVLMLFTIVGLGRELSNVLKTKTDKPCKCDCSYTVHNADSIITAKGDTIKYKWNKK